jgi:hypothetical protein
MSKKVTFNQIENDDGESGMRMELETVNEEVKQEEFAINPNLANAVPPKEPSSYQMAMDHLSDLAQFMAGKKDDQITKEYKVNPVHVQIVKDLAARKASGKPFILSDGNKEMLKLLHQRLNKRFSQ